MTPLDVRMIFVRLLPREAEVAAVSLAHLPPDEETARRRLAEQGAAIAAEGLAEPGINTGLLPAAATLSAGAVLGALRRAWLAASRLPGAVPDRQSEFVAGRLCAMRALVALEVGGEVGRDEKTREPRWPPGITGSITHTRAFAAAAVTRGPMLGIDLEPELSADALRDVRGTAISDAEWALLGEDPRLATALFSAKESLFKCLWPSTRSFLDFPDAQLVQRNADVFTLELVQSKQRHAVRYAFAHAHAFTVAAGAPTSG